MVQGGQDGRHTAMATDGDQLRSYGEDKMGKKRGEMEKIKERLMGLAGKRETF